MIDGNMNKTDLRLAAGITTTALEKLGKQNENVNTEVLAKSMGGHFAVETGPKNQSC